MPDAADAVADLVDLGEEAGDEQVGRLVVQHLGVAGLHETAGAHHGDAIADAHRLLRIVRDDDRGGARLAQQRQRLLLHRLAQLHVEAGERLVHEHHRRARDDGARQRHALLLAAGEDVRIFVGEVGEPDALQGGERLARAPPPWAAP